MRDKIFQLKNRKTKITIKKNKRMKLQFNQIVKIVHVRTM